MDDPVQIYPDVEQGSAAWFALRHGIPTASMFKVLMASGEQKGRTTYLYKLAGERLTGIPVESYSNDDMEHGKEIEPDLRRHYAFVRDCDPWTVGFVRNGKCGCSPDALIDDDRTLEIKRAAPHILIPMLLKLEADPSYFPPEHYAQCQGSLMVCDRQYCDLIVGYPKMKPLIVTTGRDERYISDLRDAVDRFDLDLRRLVEKLR